jgi:putative hydrolase of the HAD superfamily
MVRFPNVQAIFFDAVGTLIHPEPPAPVVYAEVGRRHGSRLTVEEVTHRFVEAFAREEALDLAQGWQTSEKRELQRWQRIVAAVLDDVTNPMACFAALYRHFSLSASWRCEAEVAEVLEALATRVHRLGIASNYDHRLRPVVKGLAALQPLQELVISSAVGWRKPAPQFFTALTSYAGMPTDRILLVGDDRGNDYEAARACGMPAVLFDPHGNHPDVPERITHLRELLDLVPEG